MVGASAVAGIGFTVSLFIAGPAFEPDSRPRTRPRSASCSGPTVAAGRGRSSCGGPDPPEPPAPSPAEGKPGGPSLYGTGPVKSTLRKASVAAAALPLALLSVACGGGTDRAAISIASVAGGGNGFSPASLTVEQENDVDLRVTNSTGAEHGFSIEGYRIERTLKPGETMQVKFRATRGGTFKVFCQIHPQHQTATLIVQ